MIRNGKQLQKWQKNCAELKESRWCDHEDTTQFLQGANVIQRSFDFLSIYQKFFLYVVKKAYILLTKAVSTSPLGVNVTSERTSKTSLSFKACC